MVKVWHQNSGAAAAHYGAFAAEHFGGKEIGMREGVGRVRERESLLADRGLKVITCATS